MSVQEKKSLPLAIGLNLVVPGAGYMYMGRVILGILVLLLVMLLVLTTGGLFLAPAWIGLNLIMAIDMLLLSNKNKAAVAAATTKKCPFCAETIQRDAKICRFCHSQINAQAETTVR